LRCIYLRKTKASQGLQTGLGNENDLRSFRHKITSFGPYDSNTVIYDLHENTQDQNATPSCSLQEQIEDAARVRMAVVGLWAMGYGSTGLD
jgi:hypothetical protein